MPLKIPDITYFITKLSSLVFGIISSMSERRYPIGQTRWRFRRKSQRKPGILHAMPFMVARDKEQYNKKNQDQLLSLSYLYGWVFSFYTAILVGVEFILILSSLIIIPRY